MLPAFICKYFHQSGILKRFRKKNPEKKSGFFWDLFWWTQLLIFYVIWLIMWQDWSQKSVSTMAGLLSNNLLPFFVPDDSSDWSVSVLTEPSPKIRNPTTMNFILLSNDCKVTSVCIIYNSCWTKHIHLSYGRWFLEKWHQWIRAKTKLHLDPNNELCQKVLSKKGKCERPQGQSFKDLFSKARGQKLQNRTFDNF